MKKELENNYPYISAKTYVVGSPQFDMYFNLEDLKSKNDFAAELGINPADPIVLYTTNTPTAMPEEPEIVEDIVREYQQQCPNKPVNFLVRLHPKDNKVRYTNLMKLSNVTIVQSGKYIREVLDKWIPNKENVADLRNQIYHSDILINVASTMSLEGFTLGKTTINICYTPVAQRKSLIWDFEMYHSSDHYKAIIENDAVLIARSTDDVVQFIRKDALGSSTRKKNMKTVFSEKCEYFDGNGHLRLFDAVEDIIK